MIVQYDELREYLGEETRWVAIGADAGSILAWAVRDGGYAALGDGRGAPDVLVIGGVTLAGAMRRLVTEWQLAGAPSTRMW